MANGELPNRERAAIRSKVPPLSPAVVERLVENQAQQLQLKAEELELQRQKDKNAFEFGKESLKVQAQDREKQREHDRIVRLQVLVFAGVIVLLIISLLVFSLWMGKDAFAGEVLKGAVFLVSGFAGGYGTAKIRQRPVKHD
jgi:hypothetical protein